MRGRTEGSTERGRDARGDSRGRAGPAHSEAFCQRARPRRARGTLATEREGLQRPQERGDEGGLVRVPPGPGQAPQTYPRGPDRAPPGAGRKVCGPTEGSGMSEATMETREQAATRDLERAQRGVEEVLERIKDADERVGPEDLEAAESRVRFAKARLEGLERKKQEEAEQARRDRIEALKERAL